MPAPERYGELCPICDWPHVHDHILRQPITQVVGDDPLVPPRDEWPFGGDGIRAAYVDRLHRLCFEYAQ